MFDVRLLPKDMQSELREFRAKIDLSYITLWGKKPFTQPVLVEAHFKDNGNGFYNLAYNAKTKSVFPCSRCLSEEPRDFCINEVHVLKEDINDPSFNEDRYYPIENSKFDLTEIVATDFIAMSDDYTLCKPDCKGLCPKCGANLSLKDCSCIQDENLDPRFDILRELLSKEFSD